MLSRVRHHALQPLKMSASSPSTHSTPTIRLDTPKLCAGEVLCDNPTSCAATAENVRFVGIFIGQRQRFVKITNRKMCVDDVGIRDASQKI